MIYALDTNVLAAIRRRRDEDAPALAWAEAVEQESVYIPALVLMEIEHGILLVERRGDAEQARRLGQWFDGLLASAGARVLDFTQAAAKLAAVMLADPQSPGLQDCLIAATAKAHGATIVTRNVRDFARTGVQVIDPWSQPD